VASITAIAGESTFQLIRVPKSNCKPLLCSLVIFASDMLALALSVGGVLLGNYLTGKNLVFAGYFALWPTLGLFAATFAAFGLYPGVIHSPVAELRRVVIAVTVGFLMLLGLLSLIRSPYNSREVIITCWFVTLAATLAMRSIVRELLCRKLWWGNPVAVFYTGPESIALIKQLQRHPEFGLRPVALLSPHGVARATHLPPIIDIRHAAAVRACGVERAIIALPDAESGKLLEDLEHYESLFPRLMIMHSSTALYTLAVGARDIGGSLAVEVRRNLLFAFPRIAKRFIDVSIVCLGLPVALLTVFLLGILVKFDSPGPIFYGHRRIGRNNSTFRAWKLRTMQLNSDEVLRDALASDPALRNEWYQTRKLRRDPRVTRIGRILRRTSFDELPQLWNVLRGDMSLVGPRPIVEEEVPIYGGHFPLYCRVAPGITGLWQVSGRNTVGVVDRVRLDAYYVRNWSPWLDLHILARTVRAVVAGNGAY
jgi:Undecaprenyl-phosphate galactose phosphotransferase WbaP